MAITKPTMFTSIEDAEVSFNRPVTDEVVRKIIQNVNMLNELAKIGQLIAVAVNQPGVEIPSPDQFQQCDGADIVHPNSPLQSVGGYHRITPNMKRRFPRGAQSEESNPGTAVDLTNDMRHTHTTGFVCVGKVGEDGDERHAYSDYNLCHNHGVDVDLEANDPISPRHLKVVMYLKIN